MAGMWITVIKTFKCSKINKKRLKINQIEQQLNFFAQRFYLFLWFARMWDGCEFPQVKEAYGHTVRAGTLAATPSEWMGCLALWVSVRDIHVFHLLSYAPDFSLLWNRHRMYFFTFLNSILCSLEPMSVSATWWQYWIQTRLRRYESLSWFTFCSSGLCDCKYNLCNILYSFL